MDKIKIFNPHNEPFEVIVLRYFIMGNSHILIYTLNEEDVKGYTRLYVTKIQEGVTNPLTEDEWTAVKASIRTIVNENREGVPLTARDLDFETLNGLVVEHLKIFKLQTEVLVDLVANKKSFKKVIPVMEDLDDFVNEVITENKVEPEKVIPKIEPFDYQPIVSQPASVDYKTMYEEIEKEKEKLKMEKQKLKEEMFELQSQTLSYQLKYDQIKKILEGGSVEDLMQQ